MKLSSTNDCRKFLSDETRKKILLESKNVGSDYDGVGGRNGTDPKSWKRERKIKLPNGNVARTFSNKHQFDKATIEVDENDEFVKFEFSDLYPAETKAVTAKQLQQFFYDVGECLGDSSEFGNIVNIDPMISWCSGKYPVEWKAFMEEHSSRIYKDDLNFYDIEEFLENESNDEDGLLKLINYKEEYQRMFWDAKKLNDGYNSQDD